jgi:hypothetical protein
LARLRGALDIAARAGVTVERAEGIEWLGRRLSVEPGVATVVFHSIVDPYLSSQRREEMRGLLEDIARAATPENPMAWLRMEPTREGDPAATDWARAGHPEVRLTLWPGGRERLLAWSAAHGPPVTWLGGPDG